MKRLLAVITSLALILSMSCASAEGIREENGFKTVIQQVNGVEITVATADADLSAPIAPEDNPWSDFDTSEPAHIVFYVVGTEGEDHQKVIDLVNQRMKQLINTTIEVPVMPLSDFQTKYPLVLAGGADCDIIMTHPYIGPFATQADNGAFMELTDEFLNTWMPETMKSQVPASWKQAMYKGKLYQIPRNESDYENSYGVVVRKDLRTKYNIPEIKTLDDYQAYLYAVAEGEKDTGLYAMYTNPSCPMTLTFLTGPNNWQTVGNFYWDADNETLDPDDLFISVFTPEYREYCLRMVDWAKHGVWPSNAITNVTHINDLFKDNKSASDICMYKSANEDIIKQRSLGNDAEYFSIIPETANTRISPYNYDGLAITAFCANPERAALVVDVMKNDSVIANLLQGGIEGVHYNIGEDGSRSNAADNEKYPWSGWAWCLRSHLNPSVGGILPEVAQVRAQFDKMNITAEHFPIDGFSFDTTGMEDITATINSLNLEWSTSFDLGIFGDNTEKKLDEYIELLKDAGYEELLEACKQQLRDFLANSK